MSKHEMVLQYVKILHETDKHPIGKIMSAKGYWTAGTSASNNAYKVLCDLASMKLIEKCKGFFRIPGCKSEYGEHARLLTQLLADILALPFPFEASIFREHTITEIGLRPDAIILLRHGTQALCFILEAVNQESMVSVQAKQHIWQQWPQAKQYLSKLFAVPILHYDFLRSDEFDRYREEVIYDHTYRHLHDLSHDVGTGRLRETTAGNKDH